VAKGGGGSWKVAYADFVTAMMAFFMVMWLTSQDQKIKESVARYFISPIGVSETGASNRPNRTGAVFGNPQAGEMPNSEAVNLGHGRVSHTEPTDVRSSATKVVSDWLHKKSEKDSYWQNETQAARDRAKMSKDLLKKPGSVDDVAKQQLSAVMRERISRTVQSERSELSQELLSQILAEVNWTELAEDMLSNEGQTDDRKK
jgi:chemotaxis protein MotB